MSLQEEFMLWKQEQRRCARELPSKSDVREKREELLKFKNHTHTKEVCSQAV